MIHIESSTGSLPVTAELLERAALAAISQQSVVGDLSIVLTDDNHLHKLNLEYLGFDAPTDVLSFPASEIDPETKVPYLGDILISIPRAEEQAKTAGHSLEAELQILVVHGSLHLLGFDHAETEDKARMWSAQTQVLDSIGLAGIEIRES
jgi:probable rRNA maturation factor